MLLLLRARIQDDEISCATAEIIEDLDTDNNSISSRMTVHDPADISTILLMSAPRRTPDYINFVSDNHNTIFHLRLGCRWQLYPSRR